MDTKKKNKGSENWKAEDARQERKERLAKQKDQSGNKKPIKEKGKTGKIISILLIVVIIVGFLLWFGASMGYRQRLTKAFTVSYDENAKAEENTDPSESETTESESAEAETTTTAKELKGETIDTVSVAEANIYLGLMSQQYLQGGAFSQTGQDQLSQPSQFYPNGTWRDDFLISVENQARVGSYFYWKAKQEGYELDETDQKNLDAIIEQYSSIAAQSKVTLNHYLSIMFGPGVNEKVFRDFFAKNQLGNKYYNDVYQGFTYNDAEISAKYDEDPDAYNFVDYRSYLFDGMPETTNDDSQAKDPSAETQEPDLAKAEADAKEFAAKITDEESFKKEVTTLLIKKNADKDNEADPTEDTSLSTKARRKYLSPDLSEWLFAAERKAGDIEVIKEYNGYRVVMFLEKYKPTNIGSYSTRHILFRIDENDPEKSDEKMKAKAEEVLDEFNAGAKTEEAFAELAKEYSDDPGSASNGGLYENIKIGQFVPEFEDFATNPDRQKGDVEIVKSVHGYHIIYVLSSEEEWKSMISTELRTADEQAFMADVHQKTDIRREKGIKLFGKP